MTRGFPVTDLPATDHVEVGDDAPGFTRPLVNADFWEDVPLGRLLGDGPVLLVHFPMDGTGSAKYNWIRIRDRGWADWPVTVVGVSISTPYEHKAFIDRHALPFELYSDPGAGVAEAYGTVHDMGGMAGLRAHRPAAFLVDAGGTVRYAWVADEWPASTPYDEIEAAVDGL